MVTATIRYLASFGRENQIFSNKFFIRYFLILYLFCTLCIIDHNARNTSIKLYPGFWYNTYIVPTNRAIDNAVVRNDFIRVFIFIVYFLACLNPKYSPPTTSINPTAVIINPNVALIYLLQIIV